VSGVGKDINSNTCVEGCSGRGIALWKHLGKLMLFIQQMLQELQVLVDRMNANAISMKHLLKS